MDSPFPPSAPEPSDVPFRRRHLVVAVSLGVLACAVVAAYVVATRERPHRTELAAVAGVVAGALLLLLALPVDRLLHGRPRDASFLACTAVLVGIVTLLVALDGGASPLAALYVVPLVLAAMAYPVGPTLAIVALTVGAYVAVALADGRPVADVLTFAACLATAAAACACLSRLQARERVELARLSLADPLTGSLNRHAFRDRLDAELARATRSEVPLALLLIDLDDFRVVNEEQGHAAGDELLRWVAAEVGEAIRPTDALGRIGGDEFAVLLPDAEPADASDVAIRIEASISERTAASTGIATFPGDGIVGEELHAIAARRLHEAKLGPEGVRRMADRMPR